MKKILLLLLVLMVGGCTSAQPEEPTIIPVPNAEEAHVERITNSLDILIEEVSTEETRTVTYLYPSVWPTDLFLEGTRVYGGQGYLYKEILVYDLEDESIQEVTIVIKDYSQDELYAYIQALLDAGYTGENDLHPATLSDCTLDNGVLHYHIVEVQADKGNEVSISLRAS